MPTAFMSNLEREWLKEGKKEGQEEGKLSEARSAVLEALDAKFDRAADTVADYIKGLNDVALLRALLRRAVTAPSLDDFRNQLPG